MDESPCRASSAMNSADAIPPTGAAQPLNHGTEPNAMNDTPPPREFVPATWYGTLPQHEKTGEIWFVLRTADGLVRYRMPGDQAFLLAMGILNFLWEGPVPFAELVRNAEAGGVDTAWPVARPAGDRFRGGLCALVPADGLLLEQRVPSAPCADDVKPADRSGEGVAHG